MKIAFLGPVQGNLTALYEQLEEDGIQWAICAGDYGIWVDPAQMDRASKKHDQKEFAKYYAGAITTPIKVPTLTISGVHDDNRWLKNRIAVGNTEILPHVHWLANGYKTNIGWDKPIRVTGLGRAYSEETYSGNTSSKSHRHYTRKDIERGCSSGPTEILVIYEHLDCPGIRNLIYATRPKVIVTVTRPNKKVYSEVQDIPVISLTKGDFYYTTWN